MSSPKTKKHIDIIIGIGAVLLVLLSIGLLLHPFKKAETTPVTQTPTEDPAVSDIKDLKSILTVYPDDSIELYDAIDDYLSNPDFEEIMNALQDTDIESHKQHLLIGSIYDMQIVFSEPELQTISEMCLDPQYESDIRMSMLQRMMPDSEDSMDTVNALLANDDLYIVVEALRKWSNIDLAGAAAFVYPKMIAYTSEEEDILGISVNILHDAVDAGLFDSAKFIAACETILMDPDSQILDLKHTVTANLYNLGDTPIDVFRIILDANIDEYEKQQFIERNFSILQSICLNTTPNKEDTEIIIRCMERVSIPQVIDPLSDIAAGYGLDISHLTESDI